MIRLFETPGAAMATWLVVTAAIYGCVPETDHLLHVAAGIVALLVGELVGRRPWHPIVGLGLVGVLAWAVHHGAVGRERALVGGAFAFWPVVVLAAVLLATPAPRRPGEPVRAVVVAVTGAASLVVSRTGALEPGTRPAATAAAIWGTVSLAVVAAVISTDRRRSAGRPTSSARRWQT